MEHFSTHSNFNSTPLSRHLSEIMFIYLRNLYPAVELTAFVSFSPDSAVAWMSAVLQNKPNSLVHFVSVSPGAVEGVARRPD